MPITERFASLLRDSIADDQYRPTFLPEVLTQLCVDQLPADGASLSLLSEELRMPLAASDEQARTAEMVQFTLGHGPCLDTYRTRRPAVLNHRDLGERWPLFLDALTQATAFRSVMSVPIDLGSRLVGALDLYLTSPDGMPARAADDALELGRLIGDALLRSTDPNGDDAVEPAWLRSPAIHLRSTTWIAIGLIARVADLEAIDALGLIRTYARQLNQTVDDVTFELASHNLLAQDMLDSLPAGPT